MNVWIVSPVWQRFAVTEFVLAEWAWLRDSLAPHGMAVHAVVVGDDANLDIARRHGFEAVECENSPRGRKWNTGFRFAAEHDADLFVYVGSDDWVHPYAFLNPPSGMEVQVSRNIEIVDLPRGVLQKARSRDAHGTLPWLIPREVLEKCEFAPMADRTMLGTEYAIVAGLGVRPEWKFREGKADCVDFKTAESTSPYAGTANAAFGDGIELDAGEHLSVRYPQRLVDMVLEHSKGAQ